MRVVFSTEARGDLRRIAGHLIKENQTAALALVDDLEAKAFEIADFPKRYEVLRTEDGIELRRRVVGRYLILYSVGVDRIQIVNVFHGSRDIARLLADKKS